MRALGRRRRCCSWLREREKGSAKLSLLSSLVAAGTVRVGEAPLYEERGLK